jgi:phosphodiesterase/alkaline phosphatase D-like protein
MGSTRNEGAIKSFTTASNPVTVTTTAATEISATSAMLNGESPASDATLHFEYGTDQANLSGRIDAVRGSGNAVSAVVSALAPGTTYFFRLVGINGSTRVEGQILSFTTPPVAVTDAAYDIAQTSAKLKGRGTSLGQDATFFFEYSKNSNLSGAVTTAPQVFKAENREVISEIASLELGATYYYRLVGTIGTLRSEGEIMSFSTAGAIVSTTDASEITPASARLNGQASAFGTELKLHFEYGTDINNLTSTLEAGTTTANEVAVGAVAGQLSPATTYYYRLVGVRGTTRIEGEVKSFITKPGVLTDNVLEITPTSAKLSGKATAVGNEASFFFEYSTNSNLSGAIATAPQSKKGTAVEVIENVVNLEPNAVYYYRLVGTLGSLRSEGEIKSFSTQGLVVTTKAVTDINTTSAVFNGEASAFGAELKLVFQYGLSSNNLDLTINAGTITGNNQQIKATPPNLDPATTYYYRLVGTKGSVQIEGQVLSFTTRPEVITGGVTEITQTSAMFEGVSTAVGQAADFFFEYSKSVDLSNALTTAKTPIKGSNKEVKITAASLEPATTYYYRMVGAVGTLRNEGEVKSFTTLGLIVTTKPATDVGPDTAVLNGEASTFGTAMKLYFRFGKNQDNLTDSIHIGDINGNAQAVKSAVSELEPATTYYFQLVGERDGVKLEGEVLSFVTSPPVVLADAATNVTASSARLNGQVSAYGVELKLQFELGTNPNSLVTRVNPVPDTTADNNVSIYADISRLESAKTYYYRLVGTKANGSKFYSDTKSLETLPAVSNISFIKEPGLIIKNKEGKYKADSVIIQLTPDQPGTVVKLYVKGFRNNFDEAVEYVMNAGANSTYSAALPAEQVDELGLSYYIEVTPPAGFGSVFNSAAKQVAIHYEKGLDFTSTFPFSRDSLDYEMISFPLVYEEGESIRNALVSVLDAPDPRRWRMFGYNTLIASYVEFPANVDFGRVGPGAGYWILAAPQEGKSSSYELNTGEGKTVAGEVVDGFYHIKLEKGWNFIGNPFPFDVLWKDILVASELQPETELLHWMNKDFVADTLLRKFSGAFVWSDEPDTLKIPAMKSFGTEGRPSDKKLLSDSHVNQAQMHATLDVELSLTGNGRHYSRSGLGMHPQANISKDQYDQMLLPRLISPFDISFQHPEHFARQFAKDIVPDAENYIWEFDVAAAPSEGTVTLSWKVNRNTDGKQLWLHDLSKDRVINMQEESNYQFKTNQKKQYKVYYGDREFVEQNMKPFHARMASPYPNPTFDSSTIPFTLTEEQPSFVKISVFDMRGSEVAVLTEQEYTSGFYEVTWDGKDQQGNRVNSGIYFIKAQVEGEKANQVFTEKVVLY